MCLFSLLQHFFTFSLTFMTLKIVVVILWNVLMYVSPVFYWLDSGYVSLAGISQKWTGFFSLYIIYVFPLIGDVIFEHLVKVVIGLLSTLNTFWTAETTCIRAYLKGWSNNIHILNFFHISGGRPVYPTCLPPSTVHRSTQQPCPRGPIWTKS